MSPVDPPIAYSYIRFSHPEQAKGDSLRRQTEATRAWCDRNRVRLDESTTLHDLGKSAFTGEHRRNPDRHALAAFLKLVEKGKIPRGSFLVIENLDRLSREHERAALRLWMDLLDAGVNIVQLSPETVFRHERSDMVDIIRAIIELSRGHSESRMKSERVGGAWSQKKKRGRESGEVITHMLPAWVEARDGKLHLVPEKAGAVRRVYDLALAGYGLTAIVKQLREERRPPIGTSGDWARSYVNLMLKDRRAVGEFQPRKRNGDPDGEPIAGYFPAIVSEDEWLAARDGAARRWAKRGRTGENVNVFAGLVKHARDGDGYMLNSRPSRHGHPILVNRLSAEGKARHYSLPFAVFETAVLGRLREVNVAEVLGRDNGPDEVAALEGEHARVEAYIAELEAELQPRTVKALGRELARQEDLLAEVGERLAEARQRAASPLSAALSEQKTALEALAAAADPRDARLRLRALFRRTIDCIMLLVVPRGRKRLAAVQVWFQSARKDDPATHHRDYVLFYTPAANHRPAVVLPPLSFADVAVPGDLDLRKKADALKVEKLLAAVDLADLVE